MYSVKTKDRFVFRGGKFLKRLFVGVLFTGIALLNTSVAEGAGYGSGKSSQTLRSMARVYMAYGDYTKAAPLAEDALRKARSTASSDAEMSSCYGDLAYLYKGLGKYSQAEQMCLSSISKLKQAYFDTHPYVATSLKTLASIYLDQLKVQKAKNTLDEAVEMMLDTHDAEEQVMAPFYVEYGKMYAAAGEYENAERYFSRAIRMINNSYGPNHLYTAGVLKSYADFKSQTGNYDKAKQLAEKALNIQEKVYGKKHHLLAETLVTLAGINYRQGKTHQASKMFDKAMALVNKTSNQAAADKLTAEIFSIKTGGLKTVALR